MAGYTFKGKQKLCYTEVSDFTDFQGLVTTHYTSGLTAY